MQVKAVDVLASEPAPQLPIPAAFVVCASRGAPVVVVQTSEYGMSLDAAIAAGTLRNRLLLGAKPVR